MAINSAEELSRRLEELFKTDGRSFGLDFGTFRSVMACKNIGEPTPFMAQYESYELRGGVPSLFWYDAKNDKEYVCEEVMFNNGLLDDPEGVSASVKMHLEDTHISLHGKKYEVEYIAETIVRRVLRLSHDAFRKVLFEEPEYRKLVVGVPVRFGVAQRRKLLTILQKATGLRNIIFLPEPIAAALTYEKQNRVSKRKVLVLDIGAGTFDTVLLIPNDKKTKENPYPYIPLYPDGLPVAGNQFDERMRELLLEKLRRIGEVNISKMSDPGSASFRRMTELAREAKEVLSSRDRYDGIAEVLLLNGDITLQKISVTREEFEKAIAPDVQAIVDMAYNVLVHADMQKEKDIDVLLVGGSSYIPLVRKMLQNKCSYIAAERIYQRFPEQAIAMGCAYYAEEEDCGATVAYAYAIRCYSEEKNKRWLDVVIPSHTKLPYKYEKGYLTSVDGTSSIGINIYELEQGELGQDVEVEAGRFTELCMDHDFGRVVPKNTPIQVCFELNKNGILTITLDDKGISPVQKADFDMSNLIGENK